MVLPLQYYSQLGEGELNLVFSSGQLTPDLNGEGRFLRGGLEEQMLMLEVGFISDQPICTIYRDISKSTWMLAL